MQCTGAGLPRGEKGSTASEILNQSQRTAQMTDRDVLTDEEVRKLLDLLDAAHAERWRLADQVSERFARAVDALRPLRQAP